MRNRFIICLVLFAGLLSFANAFLNSQFKSINRKLISLKNTEAGLDATAIPVQPVIENIVDANNLPPVTNEAGISQGFNDPPSENVVYVSNLPFTTNEELLQSLIGDKTTTPIKRISIPRDKYSG